MTKRVLIEKTENGFLLGTDAYGMNNVSASSKSYVFETSERLLEWLRKYFSDEPKENKRDAE